MAYELRLSLTGGMRFARGPFGSCQITWPGDSVDSASVKKCALSLRPDGHGVFQSVAGTFSIVVGKTIAHQFCVSAFGLLYFTLRKKESIDEVCKTSRQQDGSGPGECFRTLGVQVASRRTKSFTDWVSVRTVHLAQFCSAGTWRGASLGRGRGETSVMPEP